MFLAVRVEVHLMLTVELLSTLEAASTQSCLLSRYSL